MNAEKQKLISEVISLKSEHQRIFFELKKQNETLTLHTKKNEEYLKSKIASLSKELNDVKSEAIKWKENAEITTKENKHLVAQAKQIRFSVSCENVQSEKEENKNKASDNNSSKSSSDDENVYEVEKLLDDKITGRTRYFLVHWKGFGKSEDCWIPEKNLNCPKVLEKYLKSKAKN